MRGHWHHSYGTRLLFYSLRLLVFELELSSHLPLLMGNTLRNFCKHTSGRHNRSTRQEMHSEKLEDKAQIPLEGRKGWNQVLGNACDEPNGCHCFVEAEVTRISLIHTHTLPLPLSLSMYICKLYKLICGAVLSAFKPRGA